MFCPDAIVWGDVATWVAAIGTIFAAGAAVGIAIWSSRQEHQRERDVLLRQARAMAVPLHNEITHLTGQVATIESSAVVPEGTQAIAVWRDFEGSGEALSFPSLERYATRFEAFEAPVAGRLGVAIAGLSAIKSALGQSIRFGDEAAAAATLRSVRGMAHSLLPTMFALLDDLRPISAQAGFTLIETAQIRTALGR